MVKCFDQQPQEQTYDGTPPQYKGIKQESEPGISPGMQGINPVSSPSLRKQEGFSVF
jgi:hypothetical protein